MKRRFNEPYDEAVDCFSLGIVVFTMCVPDAFFHHHRIDRTSQADSPPCILGDTGGSRASS
jgi:hypothetical protein